MLVLQLKIQASNASQLRCKGGFLNVSINGEVAEKGDQAGKRILVELLDSAANVIVISRK